MKLDKIVDNRDWIGRARKRELIEIARAQGHVDIKEALPADDYTDPEGKIQHGIRTLLRQRGIKRMPLPDRPLGKIGRHATQPVVAKAATPPANALDAAEWAEFQEFKKWKAAQQPAKKPKRLVERPRSEINRLRDECKRLGIKMDRRDGTEQLKAKIAAHAENASSVLQ